MFFIPESPHFECPNWFKTLECKHQFIITIEKFNMPASKFFVDILGMYEGFRDFDMLFTKRNLTCLRCGLANTKYIYS